MFEMVLYLNHTDTQNTLRVPPRYLGMVPIVVQATITRWRDDATERGDLPSFVHSGSMILLMTHETRCRSDSIRG
jgi:hypothetical protein